jgi:hypothetical protein
MPPLDELNVNVWIEQLSALETHTACSPLRVQDASIMRDEDRPSICDYVLRLLSASFVKKLMPNSHLSTGSCRPTMRMVSNDPGSTVSKLMVG